MNNVDNEQWKHGGDCAKCRRESYCSKPCTLRKRIGHARMKAAVADVLNRATGGVMKDAIEKTVRDYI